MAFGCGYSEFREKSGYTRRKLDRKLFILVIPVPNELNVSNMFNPDMYNEAFIFVVLFNVVNPDTFNDDNNVVSFTN